MPKDFPAELVAELDTAMEKVSADPQFNEDLGRMNYRAGFLNAADAKAFIYGKRDGIQTLIDNSPSLDDLVQK